MRLEQSQGATEDGATFGYVHGDGGGYFFTWRPTLEETLSSVEEDAVDGGGGLSKGAVASFLRRRLPATAMGKRLWM